MARNKSRFYVVDEADFEMTPWQQMRAQYDAATDNYKIESRRPPMRGEDPSSIEQVAAKNFYYACIAIKNQHPDVDNYPCPLSIDGKQYDASGTKMLIKDRYGNDDDTHDSLKSLFSLSEKYDEKSIFDVVR